MDGLIAEPPVRISLVQPTGGRHVLLIEITTIRDDRYSLLATPLIAGCVMRRRLIALLGLLGLILGLAVAPPAAAVGAKPAAPVLSGLSPARTVVGAAPRVRLVGTGLGGVQSVMFGAAAATEMSTVDGDLVVTAPVRLTPGAVDVVVATDAGRSPVTAATRFTYDLAPKPVVTMVTPAQSALDVTLPVAVTGTGLLGATAVRFGNELATDLRVLSDTQLTVTAPARS